MRFLKPSWISHDKLEIYSVDIHPDGSRFATGGQGQDSGRIVVWNMLPVIDAKSEANENIPKMLCQMDNHLACVNCVRWNGEGRLLASGGDDKLIMIWKQTASSSFPSGGCGIFSGSSGPETWRCQVTLRGHDGDVLDLAWSPDDRWLASCSIDNSIIVWDALKLPERVALLKGHTGMVKGVTWDPVGKYLASQADDKSLRVWRTFDWRLEATFTEPFAECSGTTHVLRLSWSPDGQYLVSAHAMNGGGPTARIVERDGWRQDKDFVGHRKAVTCVRFNTNILQKTLHSSSKPQQYCCCAIGSRDRGLSVWLTSLKRPLVVIENLFTGTVLDIAWSRSGLQLIACSTDGTVAYVSFGENELGKPLSSDEKLAIHERLYGKSLGSNLQSHVIEDCELLSGTGSLQEKKEEIKPPPPTPKVNSTLKPVELNQSPLKPPIQSPSIQPTISPTIRPINKQIETRRPDGKRRITPMYFPPTQDTSNEPTIFTSSSQTHNSIIFERRFEEDSKKDEKEPNNSTPMINNSNALINSTSANLKRKIDSDSPNTITFKKPNLQIPNASSNATSRILSTTGSTLATASTLATSLESHRLANMRCRSISVGLHEIQVDTITSQSGKISSLRLILKKPKGNHQNPEEKTEEEIEWTTLIGQQANGLAANKRFVALSCLDPPTLHIFHFETGERTLPPIVLNGAAHRIFITECDHLLVVTILASLSAWKLAGDRKSTKIVNDKSLAPMLLQEQSSVYVSSCSMNDHGEPLVALSTGKSFMYSIQLGCWLLLGDSKDPLRKLSVHETFYETLSTTFKPNTMPLATLQSSWINTTRRQSIKNLACAEIPHSTASFLDLQLAACKQLNSSIEYKTWLLTLTRYLVHNGMESKMRRICESLLGPAHSKAQNSEPTIMGFPGRTLLKDILAIMAKNLKMQRLYVEIKDQLTMLDT